MLKWLRYSARDSSGSCSCLLRCTPKKNTHKQYIQKNRKTTQLKNNFHKCRDLGVTRVRFAVLDQKVGVRTVVLVVSLIENVSGARREKIACPPRTSLSRNPVKLRDWT